MSASNDPDRTADLWTRVHRSLARERGPIAWLRARPTSQRVAGSVGMALLIAALTALLALRSDLQAHAPAIFAGGLALMGLALVASAVLLLRPLHRGTLPPGLRLAVATIALLLPFGLVLLAPAHDAQHVHPESFADGGASFWPRAGACFGLGLCLGLPVLVLLLALDRRPGRGSWPHVLLLAALAGLTGNLALTLHCPLVRGDHLLVGHAAVPLGILALLGLLLLRRRARDARSGRA